ncbi:hypothetical protein V8C43DRAFT_233560 [Trichoderma afarasin]
MFSDRMSRRLPSYVLFLLITLIYTVTAAPLNSSGDIDSFIPSCAAQCFNSFLNISYADRPARTLAALCPRIGAYGFTIGEAAVQCLAVERAAGACSKQVASDAVIDKAFFMCYGQPGAVQPTHSVITATLAVPLFGTGPITFPPETKTSHKTSIPTAIASQTLPSSLSLPTTLVTDPTSFSSSRPSRTGSTKGPTTKPTTKPSSTSRKSSTTSPAEILTTDPVAPTFTETSTSATETSTTTNVPDGVLGGQGEKKASVSLSTGQVAGIAIGCIVGVGFIGFGIAVFCRCLRKRRSRFGRKMRKGGRPLRDSWNSNAEKGPHGGGGTDSWIANQLRAPLDPGPMPGPTKSWYNRASWRPSAIGLAISPANTRDVTRQTTPTSARPLSKLLPAKPVMNQGPPRLEVSLPSRDGDSHFGAAAIMGAAAAGAASGAIMSGAIAASSSPKPAAQPKAQPFMKPMVRPAMRQPAMPEPSVRPRNLTPPGKPQSPSPLKLIIPKTGNLKPFVPVVTRHDSSITAITRHDSSTTEFEEDGRSSLSPGGQIWRPPSADPHKAAPYYVADRSGNWRLGDPARAQEIAELEASISPLTAAPKSAAPKLVAGLGLATGAAGALALVKAASQRRDNRAGEAPKAAEETRQGALGITMPPEQTIRAVEPSLSSDEEIQEQDLQPYAPRPLFSNNGNNNNYPRRSLTNRRSSTRSLTRPRITSTDSGITTISTSTDDTDLRSPPPLEQPSNLSPVVESPRSLRPRRGQSPTQYPKIPASLGAGAAMPYSGNLNSDAAAAKSVAVATGYAKPTAMGDRPAQPSPSFGAPLAAGTMSSADGNMPKNQGKKFMGPRAMESPGAIRTGSPMMRGEGSAFKPDERYYQGPRNQAPQQVGPASQPGSSSRPYPPKQQQQQQQQYPAPTHQRRPSNNSSIPYRLPPHPTAYRPNIDSSGYPYQTRLPEYNNQGPSTYNLPHPPQPNRYPHHHPRNHQPPFVQQPAARPVSQHLQQLQQIQQRQQQPSQRPQQPQPQPQQQQQRRPQQQNLHLQPLAPSYYPDALPPTGPLTGNSMATTTSAHSADSQTSSLLAKRLGTSRAANMAIPVPPPSGKSSSAQSKWLRQGADLSSPRMPPPPQEPTELPATPVWKPRLTPTRRGDDLFLIAQ